MSPQPKNHTRVHSTLLVVLTLAAAVPRSEVPAGTIVAKCTAEMIDLGKL
eukprot:SAG11_NODE_14185_length_622_cov_0.873805_1_plen_50_part_00